MTLVFSIQTTPLGIASGMDKVETVRASNSSDSFSHEGGMLSFTIGRDIIIYAPGTWGMVTTTNEE